MSADDDAPHTPDALLRNAAAADAAHARELLARITTTRLLDLVVAQAEMAVDEDRPRRAGIDAVGDLERAAIEILDVPQCASLELAGDDPLAPPTVTGWELLTVEPDDLGTATLSLTTRPWWLALVAFSDGREREGATRRHVVAAAADGRVARATLRLRDPLDDPDVVVASVSRDAGDLRADTHLARALLAALETSRAPDRA